MRITGEAKLLEGKSPESELSVSVIPVHESKKEEKILVLSSAMTKLVVDIKKDKQISGYSEGVKKKEVEEKDVSEGLILIDDTKKCRRS